MPSSLVLPLLGVPLAEALLLLRRLRGELLLGDRVISSDGTTIGTSLVVAEGVFPEIGMAARMGVESAPVDVVMLEFADSSVATRANTSTTS